MGAAIVSDGQVQAPIQATGALAQAGTGSLALVTGSEINAGPYLALSYTLTVATNAMDWQVFGANLSDYSDEQSVYSKTNVLAAAGDSYTVFPAPFLYYRAKVKNNAGGTGTATVTGVAKR